MTIGDESLHVFQLPPASDRDTPATTRHHTIQKFNPLTPTVPMCTAIKHSVQDRVKTPFVIFDIRALVATVGAKGLFQLSDKQISRPPPQHTAVFDG